MPLFFQAADLLRHPHLQSHILKINLKVNNPRRNTFPMQWSDSDYVKKARFVEPEAVTVLTDTEKRSSYNNDRALNPSISGTELDSPCSSQRARHFPAFLNKKFSEFSVGSINEDGDGDKSTATKLIPIKPSLKPLTLSNSLKTSLNCEFQRGNLDEPTSPAGLPVVILGSGAVSRYIWDGSELKLVSLDGNNAVSLKSLLFSDFEDGFGKLFRMCSLGVRNFFLPRQVTGNYLEYVKWKLLHRVFSSALQVLATQVG